MLGEKEHDHPPKEVESGEYDRNVLIDATMNLESTHNVAVRRLVQAHQVDQTPELVRHEVLDEDVDHVDGGKRAHKHIALGHVWPPVLIGGALGSSWRLSESIWRLATSSTRSIEIAVPPLELVAVFILVATISANQMIKIEGVEVEVDLDRSATQAGQVGPPFFRQYSFLNVRHVCAS